MRQGGSAESATRSNLQSRVSSTRNLNSRKASRSGNQVSYLTRWVIKERLPFFVNSELYRTYKFFIELTTAKTATKTNTSNVENISLTDKDSSTTKRSKRIRAKSSKASQLPPLVVCAASSPKNLSIKRSQSFPAIPSKDINNNNINNSNNNSDNNNKNINNKNSSSDENESTTTSRPASVLEFNALEDAVDEYLIPSSPAQMIDVERISCFQKVRNLRTNYLKMSSVVFHVLYICDCYAGTFE